jgi:hypothetical protein
MAGDLVELRCRGCWRLLGVSKRDHPMWCDEACHDDFPVSSTEARDALMEAIFLKGGHTHETLGAKFGVTRTRAHQIISKRDERSL